MKPTKEQEQKFWVGCGFKQFAWASKIDGDDRGIGWEYPDGSKLHKLPPIDLNNLFKYAVPKLKELYKRREIEYATLCVTLENWLDIVEDTDEDPALALFWAIYKVMESQA